MQPEELRRFLAVLQILKTYPVPPPTTSTATQQQRSADRFSVKRVLRITGWFFSVMVILLALLTFAANEQPGLAMLTLVAGLLFPVIVGLKARRRARLQVTADSREENAVASMPCVDTGTPTDQSNDAHVVSDFTPADDVYPLQNSSPPPTSAPATLTRRLLVFIGSLSIWVAFALASLPDLTTTWLISTILLHEVGHFVAMYFRGYSNLAMFFIPFFAGAVTGRKVNATLSDELIMLFCGPVPGLLLGGLIYWLDTLQPIPQARSAAIWLVAINLLNLLPVWPLDGGRICWILFARRSAVAQTILSACSFVGFSLLLVAPQGGTTFLVIMALLLFMWTPPRYRQARAALQFQQLYPNPPETIIKLSSRQLLLLYQFIGPVQTVRQHAQQMINCYHRVALLPKSQPQFPWLLLYILLWLLTLVTAAGTALQNDASNSSAALSTLFELMIPK